ncbi:MAG: VCBS repeat-containing protein [Deltaproteobacteria bacterium]|nr:VCBS repeat-containing protein [Deltaproteobacteria bacterium]
MPSPARSTFLRLLALCCVPAVGACYLTNTREEGEAGPRDAGRDAHVSIDASRDVYLHDGELPPDVFEMPVLDGGIDVGTDAILGAPDALEPALEAHPDPSGCLVRPAIDPFDAPVLERWWPGGREVERPAFVHVCATPVVIDPDSTDGGDIHPIVAFVSYESLEDEQGVLRMWDPMTDETVSYPADPLQNGPFEASTNIAAGDIDGDGFAEFVGLGVYESMYAVNHDGTLLWVTPYPTASDRGERRNRSIGGAPTLADLDGDGTVEVVAGRWILEGRTGRLIANGRDDTSRGVNQQLGPISCVADLDGDGIQEVIAGNAAIRMDGSYLWHNTDLFDGFCAVADIVDDEGPEVALVARGWVRLLDNLDGHVLWERRIEGLSGQPGGGAPTVGDFDGDGDVELAIAHASLYGVYDPDCLSAGNPAGCGDFGLRWVAPSDDGSSSVTGSSLFDFNGDGRTEVIYNDQYRFFIFDGQTGTTLFTNPNSSRTRTENPTIADVDSDGNAEIIFSANAEAFFLRPRLTEPGVFIWGDARGRWVGARRVWNQHAYHITNVTEDGLITGPETPSWTQSNTYRQNVAERRDEVLYSPDLWGGRGRFVCTSSGRVALSVDVQNWGLNRVGAGIVVSFWRGAPGMGTRVAEAVTTTTLLPEGGSETVTVEITVPRGPATDYYAVVDDPLDLPGGAANECREDNNTVLIWRVGC